MRITSNLKEGITIKKLLFFLLMLSTFINIQFITLNNPKPDSLKPEDVEITANFYPLPTVHHYITRLGLAPELTAQWERQYQSEKNKTKQVYISWNIPNQRSEKLLYAPYIVIDHPKGWLNLGVHPGFPLMSIRSLPAELEKLLNTEITNQWVLHPKSFGQGFIELVIKAEAFNQNDEVAVYFLYYDQTNKQGWVKIVKPNLNIPGSEL